MSPQDIQFISEAARAAYLIKQRLEHIQNELTSKVFEVDIAALSSMSIGLTLITDKLQNPQDVPPEYN